MNTKPFSDLTMDPQSAWEPFESTSHRPWSNRLAAHLFRRAGFGGTIKQIVAAKEKGLEKTLADLFDLDQAKPYDEDMATAGRLLTTGTDSKNLAAWWLLRMAKTPCPLQEKMTLFWHGHFATGADKVNNPRAMLRQNRLIRKHCLAKFRPLVSELSRDVAMLIYLDSTENRKTRPNENYARELMELFCLGPGNYNETDIKEIARCFTGWEVRHNKFKFNSYQHDTGSKSFLGVTGQYDGDDAIDIILQQPAAGTFLARKLIRFFVFDDAPISDELARPLAVVLSESGFDIRLALKKIFSSRLFYSDLAIGQKIKSPVELAIGTLRFFDASVNLQQLANRLQRIGQLPLYPPNVKGWDGGRTWINAATILARANLLEEIFTRNDTEYASGSLKQWISQNSNELDAESDWVNEFLFATPLSAEITASLRSEFKQNPAMAMSCVAALPEFQLN